MIDILLGFLGGITCTALAFTSKNITVSKSKNKFNNPDMYGAYNWLWHNDCLTNKSGFLCPKCQNYRSNTKNGDICECQEYPELHFHLVCNDCKFKILMKTADTK